MISSELVVVICLNLKMFSEFVRIRSKTFPWRVDGKIFICWKEKSSRESQNIVSSYDLGSPIPSFFHLIWGKLKSSSKHILEIFFAADDKTACRFVLNDELFAFGGLYIQIKVMLQFWFSVTLTARILSVTGVSQVDDDSEFLTAIRTPPPILSPVLSILGIVYPCGISSLFETLDVSHVSVIAKTSQSALYKVLEISNFVHRLLYCFDTPGI